MAQDNVYVDREQARIRAVSPALTPRLPSPRSRSRSRVATDQDRSHEHIFSTTPLPQPNYEQFVFDSQVSIVDAYLHRRRHLPKKEDIIRVSRVA
jgi:hypothetical protein